MLILISAKVDSKQITSNKGDYIMNKHLFNQEDIASPNNCAAKIKVQNVKANTDRTFPRDVFFAYLSKID